MVVRNSGDDEAVPTLGSEGHRPVTEGAQPIATGQSTTPADGGAAHSADSAAANSAPTSADSGAPTPAPLSPADGGAPTPARSSPLPADSTSSDGMAPESGTLRDEYEGNGIRRWAYALGTAALLAVVGGSCWLIGRYQGTESAELEKSVLRQEYHSAAKDRDDSIAAAEDTFREKEAKAKQTLEEYLKQLELEKQASAQKDAELADYKARVAATEANAASKTKAAAKAPAKTAEPVAAPAPMTVVVSSTDEKTKALEEQVAQLKKQIGRKDHRTPLQAVFGTNKVPNEYSTKEMWCAASTGRYNHTTEDGDVTKHKDDVMSAPTRFVGATINTPTKLLRDATHGVPLLKYVTFFADEFVEPFAFALDDFVTGMDSLIRGKKSMKEVPDTKQDHAFNTADPAARGIGAAQSVGAVGRAYLAVRVSMGDYSDSHHGEVPPEKKGIQGTMTGGNEF